MYYDTRCYKSDWIFLLIFVYIKKIWTSVLSQNFNLFHINSFEVSELLSMRVLLEDSLNAFNTETVQQCGLN